MLNKKWLKNITALVMSIVLLITTVPLVLAVDVTPQAYNPSPIFSDAAREQGAAAWLEEDGEIMVEFPSAEGGLTYQGYKQKEQERQTLGDAGVEAKAYETKEIAAYVLQLYDLGSKLEAYEIDNNPLSITVDKNGAASGYAAGTITAVFPKDKVAEWIASKATKDAQGIDLTNRRYSVTITAVDKDGWLSQEMYAYVSDVPIFSLADEEMAPMTANQNAMREMVRFESKATGTSDEVYSSSGDGSKVLDRVESGGTIETKGKVDQTGVRDPNGTTDTGAYRILIKGTPTAGGQSFDTAWSRETWSYSGAEEVWFWFDLSQVDMKGISFRLRTNEKQWTDRGGESYDGTALTQVYEASNYADKYGTVYSTVGAVTGGKTPYVYVQQEDGSWQKVVMTNGTIDLAHFKGYVRVPMEFFCSETATSVQLSNQDMALKQNLATNSNQQPAKDFMNAQYLKDSGGNLTEVQVDPAGTNIEDALLIQRRGIYSQKYKTGLWSTKTWNMTYMKTGIISSDSGSDATFISDGNMLAIRANSDLNSIDYANTATVNTSTLQIENREKGLKAIDDVMSAGFAYTGITEGSVDKSVYIDNVLFYRTTGKYDSNSIDGSTKEGFSVDTYYNQKYYIREAIFDAIDKYISSTPNYSDYRAVKYIANMINNYKRVYQNAGQYSDGFLDYDKDINSASYGQGVMMDAANALGRGTAWQKYLDARKACIQEGTIKLTSMGGDDFVIKNINNSAVNDLVPAMIKTMEKLPDPDSVHQVSDALRTEIVKLYRIYTRLNLGQLMLLGDEEEARLIKYFDLVVNAIGGGFVTGKRLANMPYILFNDFETATATENGRVYQIENDPTYSSDTDYAHTKGLGTLSTSTEQYATDKDSGLMKSGIGFLPNASWATITNNGFKNSKGATVTIDNAGTGSVNSSTTNNKSYGTWHSISFSKNSADAATYTDMQSNNMTAENLGMFAGKNTQALEDSTTEMPFSLIFYADFSEISNFRFNVTIYTKDDQGNLVRARSDMGVAKPEKWTKFFILNPDTGLWEVCHHNLQYAYDSNGKDGDTINLNNYKGYVMLPLYTFKVRTGLSSIDIMDNETSLNSIYKIEFMIASPDGLNNKTYTIDNVGFSYDPAVSQYADVHAQRQAANMDITYAEMFGAKSDQAEAFEKAVADIDPYASEADLNTAIADADTLYNSLGSYQYTLQSVIQAKAELESYRDGSYVAANPKSEKDAAAITVDINALPDLAKSAYTVNDHDLPYPGYNADGTVNYAAYGFADRTAAEAAVTLYEQHYKRMADSEVASIAEETKTALINSYSAARRCLSLEDMKVSATTFLAGLTGVYTASTKDGLKTQYTSIANRDAVDQKWDEIYNRNMPYFAKSILASGGMGDALKVAQYANLGIPRFLRNAQSSEINVGVTLNDGTDVTRGGIVKLQEKYTDIYNMAKDKVASQTAFSVDELQQISDAVGEYDSLLQAYHDVTELYDVIEDIKHLFPVHNISLDKESVSYTADNWSTPQTVTYSVAYTESFPVPADADLNKIKITAANGKLTNVLNEESEYEVTVTLNGTSVTYTGAQLLAGVTFDTAVTNNLNSQGVTLSLVLADQPTAANSISDTLTIELVDKDGNVVQSRSGAADSVGWNTLEPVESKTVTFSYTKEDSYTITIPAEISIPWNSTEAHEAGYKVETSLAEGSKVTVSVSNDGTNTLTENSNTYTLAYTPTNFGTAKEFTGITNTDITGTADSPTITVSGWDQAAIGEYRTTLTYTVDYTKGS